jgi:hypothetical protein
LRPELVVRSGIERAETKIHRLSLAKGQYARIVADQFEIDLSIGILDQAGARIAPCDTSEWGREVCSVVAPSDGVYTIMVRARR